MGTQSDNHFARRTDDRQSEGYTPDKPAAWPGVLIALACWAFIVCLFTLLGLPFVDWLVTQHGGRP